MAHLDSDCRGLRILLVGTYPPPYGGIASHLTTLIPGLKARGAEDIAVVTFGGEDGAENVEGARVYRFNIRNHLARLADPAGWRILFRVFRDLGPARIGLAAFIRETIKALLVNEVANIHNSQVVSFYHSNCLELLPLGNVWGASRGIVLTVFGEVYDSPEAMNARRELVNRIINAPHAVVSSSKHCARSFSTIGITRTIEPVYYGVELNDVTSHDDRKQFRESHGIGSNEVVVLFMGRFLKEMGLDILLLAAPVLLDRSPRVRLLIAGARGDLSEQADALASTYPQRVLVMQDVTFRQQRTLYSAADLLVAPSFNQRACMGMAIKEAMAAALPVIGGAGGGMPEAIVDGETGFLIPLDRTGAVDRDRFVECVLKLVDEPALRKQFGNAGRSRAENLFSFERTNQRMAEIFMAAVPR